MRIGSAPLLLQIFQFLKHRIDRATPIDLGWRLCYSEIVMLEMGWWLGRVCRVEALIEPDNVVA